MHSLYALEDLCVVTCYKKMYVGNHNLTNGSNDMPFRNDVKTQKQGKNPSFKSLLKL